MISHWLHLFRFMMLFHRKVRKKDMIRWAIVIFVALLVFSHLLPWLEKIGLGRLPGDLRFKLFGKVFLLPFASTMVLSIAMVLLAKFLP